MHTVKVRDLVAAARRRTGSLRRADCCNPLVVERAARERFTRVLRAAVGPGETGVALTAPRGSRRHWRRRRRRGAPRRPPMTRAPPRSGRRRPRGARRRWRASSRRTSASPSGFSATSTRTQRCPSTTSRLTPSSMWRAETALQNAFGYIVTRCKFQQQKHQHIMFKSSNISKRSSQVPLCTSNKSIATR